MSLTSWIRGLFSSVGPDDEAAEREELGLEGRDETGLDPDSSRGLATAESDELARRDVEAFERPPDPNP